MSRSRNNNLLFGISLWIPAVVLVVAAFFTSLGFNNNCGGYLVRASNANTIQLAHQELSRSISYLEAEGITSGYTSIIYRTPDEDIEYWYRNLKAAQSELAGLLAQGEKVSALEQSNCLLKLRDTLMDHSGENGKEALTMPHGISRYPSNGKFAVWLIIAAGMALVGTIIAGVKD